MRFLILAFACLAAAALTGCSHPAASTQGQTSNPTLTVAQQFAQLQTEGKLPTLDVSSTVTGTVTNGNGIRDDLNNYIASLTDSAVQKNALIQVTQAIQAAMTVDTTNAAAVATVSLNLNRADTCVWSVYSSGQSTKVMVMEELSVNTLNRLEAYEQYNAAGDGAVVPSLTGNTCN